MRKCSITKNGAESFPFWSHSIDQDFKVQAFLEDLNKTVYSTIIHHVDVWFGHGHVLAWRLQSRRFACQGKSERNLT